MKNTQSEKVKLYVTTVSKTCIAGRLLIEVKQISDISLIGFISFHIIMIKNTYTNNGYRKMVLSVEYEKFSKENVILSYSFAMFRHVLLSYTDSFVHPALYIYM